MSGVGLHLVAATIPPVVGSDPADLTQGVDHPPGQGPAPPSDRLREVLGAVSGSMDVAEPELPAPAEPEEPGVDAVRARLALLGLRFPR